MAESETVPGAGSLAKHPDPGIRITRDMAQNRTGSKYQAKCYRTFECQKLNQKAAFDHTPD